MFSLEEWKAAKELRIAGEVLVFPCLEDLTIIWCPKLSYLPNSLHTYISLQKLVVRYCGDLRCLPGVPFIIRCGIKELPSGLQSVEYLEKRG